MQLQLLKQLRLSLQPLLSIRLKVVYYRNKKRHFIGILRVISSQLQYFYSLLGIYKVLRSLISCPLSSLCEWLEFLFIFLSIKTCLIFFFCFLLSCVETHFQFNTNIFFGLVKWKGKDDHVLS